MFQDSVRRFVGLTTALIVALVISAQHALAVVLPDPGTIDGTASSVSSSPELEVLGQSWQGALMIVVAGIAVVVLAVAVTHRHHRVIHA